MVVLSIQVKSCLKEFEQLLTFTVEEERQHPFLVQSRTNCQMQVRLLMGILIAFVQEEGVSGNYLPTYLLKPNKNCGRDVEMIGKALQSVLEEMADMEEKENVAKEQKNPPTTTSTTTTTTTTTIPTLSENSTELSANETMDNFTTSFFDTLPTQSTTVGAVNVDYTPFLAPFKKYVKVFMGKDQTVTRCCNEYKVVLKDTISWMDEVLDITNVLIKQKMFTGNPYNFTAEEEILLKDEILVENFLYKYSYNRIEKLEFLEPFQSGDHSSEILTNINTFVERIENKLTDPLHARMKKITRDLEMYYLTVLRKASRLQKYLAPKEFYLKASKMKIWKVPVPNLETPEKYSDRGREYWKVWNRDVEIEEFSKSVAPKHIKGKNVRIIL